MSPLQAMERSYAALRQMLCDGVHPPGHRLEANRIADELGVSMTPVRDALNRLVGEKLVEASAGEGFHVPRLDEGALRDLYEWHSALVTIAVRTARLSGPAAPGEADTQDVSLADETAQVFERLASLAPNRELRAAIASAALRLHPFRRIESRVLQPVMGELDELRAGESALPQALRRYHLRRMKAIPALLRERNRA